MSKKETEISGDVTGHLNRIRHEFVDQIWKRLFFLALVGAPISISRTVYTGWLPLYTVHLFLAVFAIGVVISLDKMSFQQKSGLLLFLLWAIGLPGIVTFGLLATSIWWLVLSCLVASIVISVRAGSIMAIIAGLFLGIVGFGFVSGSLTYGMDTNDYLTQPISWITLVTASGIFIFIIIQSIGTYNRSIVGLLQEVRTQRDQIEHLAMHDGLTGLPLKRLAEDRIRIAFHSARRRHKIVALLFVDLDRFKAVNDTYNHEAGDLVLQEVAKRLVGAIRGEDTAARIGGDEFLVILGDLTDADAAVQLADRIVNDISMPIAYKNHSITVGVSVGISLFPEHSDDMQALLKIADEAMYSVKKSGKNGYAVGI